MLMVIENVGMWDGAYTLYKASWRGMFCYGTSHIQAMSNLLGAIEGLKWENYAKQLI